jgi:parallel beta-helix repeat protein
MISSENTGILLSFLGGSMKTRFLHRDQAIAGILGKLESGDTLLLDKGCWNLDSTWVLDLDLNIIGAGTGESKLVFSDPGLGMRLDSGARLMLKDLELHFPGLQEPSTLLEVKSGKVLADSCIFSCNPEAPKPSGFLSSSQKDGIVVLHDSEIEMHDCQIFNFPGAGLNLKDEANGRLIDSTLANNGQGAVFQKQASGSFIRNSASENQTGLSLHSAGACEAAHNTCQNNSRSGISTSALKARIVFNNCISNGTGIFVSGRSQAFLRKNDCCDNRENGIIFMSHATGTAQDNYCCNNGENGIYIDDDAYPSIYNNECSENGDSGMRFMDHSRPSVSGNRCHKNRVFGIYKAGRSHPNFSENEASDNGKEDFCYASPSPYDATAR